MRLKIIVNAIRCKNCLSVIESVDHHDMKWCTCGKVAIDGGTQYLKRTGLLEDYDELSYCVPLNE
ncbi:DUF7695 domain-containing protein [Paenibacillus glycanilyticus]|uniref:DUF7695 domain-containing protein n=1 Tax=Paenibacillus glycanilyticus TaxID=126569 RepID=A0ABQ6GMC0_9BACL|nr:hypothetical protein MU1_57730 [Paenibacillus glycanilyticus]